MFERELVEGAEASGAAQGSFIWARARQAILRLRPGAGVLRTCAALCDALVEVFKFPAARLWLRSLPGDCAGCPAAEGCPKTVCYRLVAGAGPYEVIGAERPCFGPGVHVEGKVARSRAPYVTNRVLEAADLVRQSYAEREYLVAYGAYPLLREEEVLGVVGLFSFYPIDEEVAGALELLFHAAALAISGAMEAAEAEKRLSMQMRPALRRDSSRSRESAGGQLLSPEFVRRFSHEVRTHATGLLALVDMVAARGGDELTGKLSDAARDMFEMLDEVITLMSLDTGTLKIRPQPGELGAALERMLERCAPLAEPKGQHLELVRTPLPVNTVFDETALLLVLSVLVDNACKNSPEGSRIRVTLKQVPGEAVISVRDQGPGVSQEVAQTLFSPFEREEHGFGRHGLNLAIARSFVELWGGAIWFANLPEGGSEFFFTLPVK